MAAPSSSACCAAARAASGLPASSFTRSWISGDLNSVSAISAALRMAWPASPALPPADSGRISATLTWPVPIVVPASGGGAAAGGGLDEKKLELEKMLELLEQPPSNAAVLASKPASERRRDSLAADGRTCNSADNTVLPPPRLGATA